MDPEKIKRFLLGNLGLNKTAAEEWLSRVSPAEGADPAEGFQPLSIRQNPKDNEVYVYGIIVSAMEQAWLEGWLGEGLMVSNQSFRNRLNDISGDVVVRIDSPGGEVWQASGIIQAINERRKGGDKVTAVIDGLAASAASLIAVTPEFTSMAPMAKMMIHQASAWVYGNADDLRKLAGVLESTDTSMVNLYSKKMSKNKDEIQAMLKEETWFSAEEALEVSLVDEIYEVENRASASAAAAEKEIMERRQANVLSLSGLAI